MFEYTDALAMLVEVKTLVNSAMLNFAIFLVVYKVVLPSLFRAWKIDTVLVIGILYLLLQASLRTGGGSWGRMVGRLGHVMFVPSKYKKTDIINGMTNVLSIGEAYATSYSITKIPGSDTQESAREDWNKTWPKSPGNSLHG